MTDPNDPKQPDPTTSQPEPAASPSWTPPPPTSTAPPPPEYQGGYQPAVPSGDQMGNAGQPSRRNAPDIKISAPLVLGVLAVVGVVLGLLLKVADKSNPISNANGAAGFAKVRLWDTMGWTWAIVAIAAAVATLLPALRSLVNLDYELAVRIATVGAGTLVFWWVLFVLPRIELNTAFIATVGVAAGLGAAWYATSDRRAATS